MRTNLANFLRKITLCAATAVACAFGSYVRAHDLPNFIPYHELGADCLGVRAPAAVAPPAVAAIAQPANSALRFTCPVHDAMAQLQRLTKGIDTKASLQTAIDRLHNTADQLFSGANLCLNAVGYREFELKAELPEDALPPAPQVDRLPARAVAATEPTMPLVARNYVEDYLPYDLCIRDWQFGRFSYRGLSRTAHLAAPATEASTATLLARSFPAETVSAVPTERKLTASSKQLRMLSETIRNIESRQCELCSELCSFNSVSNFGSYLATSWRDLNVAAGDMLASQLRQPAPTTKRAPYFSEPQFVVYDVAGKYFVLPVDQALAWERTRKSESRPTSTENQFVATNAGPATAHDVEGNLLSFASRQLANLGSTCLNISKQLDAYKNQRVASRTGRNIR